MSVYSVVVKDSYGFKRGDVIKVSIPNFNISGNYLIMNVEPTKDGVKLTLMLDSRGKMVKK